MKIVVLDGYAANPNDIPWDEMAKLGELTVYDRTPVEEIPARMAGAQAVFTNKAPITRATIEACPDLKFIGVLATGFNIVDTAAAREHGIPVCNIPAYSTNSVAQMVFSHILEICLHVGDHSAAIHKGRWTASPDFAYWDYPLIELFGKTLGIIGYGQIGKAVANIAKAFGMNVICASLRGTTGEGYVPLDELFAKSDIISLHCPLSDLSQNLIREETIAKMKDGVILINTSRGPVVNEADLAAALKSGKVYAAGVDVVSAEPIKADNPLLGLDNCFITPHIAWAPKEARLRLMDIAVKNLAAFQAGKPQNVVN